MGGEEEVNKVDRGQGTVGEKDKDEEEEKVGGSLVTREE